MLMRNIMNYAGTSFCRIYVAVGIKRIDFLQSDEKGGNRYE